MTVLALAWAASGCAWFFKPARIAPREAAPPEVERVVPSIDVGFLSDVGDAIYFERGSSDLTDGARETLRAQADWLAQHAAPDAVIRLEGNCEAADAATEDDALALGVRRTLAAHDFLIELGVPPRRITIQSNGTARPRDPRDSEAARAMNRNVTTVLHGEP